MKYYHLYCLALIGMVTIFKRGTVVVEASSFLRVADVDNGSEPDITTEDDGEFWSRYLYAYKKHKHKFKPPLNKWTFAPTEMSISEMPSVPPTFSPSASPSESPSASPSASPSETPTTNPSVSPSSQPSTAPSVIPSTTPSVTPSATPSITPTLFPSTHPTPTPSNAPSTLPSKTPSTSPTDTPTITSSNTPSVSPSTTPSATPSDSPSVTPSISPSAAPSVSPSESPSVSPSSSPSVSPSVTPSFSPSGSPSMEPSTFPSISPTQPPTSSPTVPPPCLTTSTQICTNCTIDLVQQTDCEDRPFRYEFFFRGGNCTENDFDQPIDRVECVDFPDNPGTIPDLGSGEAAFVRLFRRNRNEDPIFEGLVNEGETYEVNCGERDCPADMRVDTYPPGTSVFTEDTIWQSVEFHSSCSQPLLCFNTFGGHQIIGWENNDQGAINCFDDVFVRTTVLVVVEAAVLPPADDRLVLETLEVRTGNYVTMPGTTSGNMNEVINLNDQIRGQSVGVGLPPATASYPALLDLRNYFEYEARIFSVGTTPSGFRCEARLEDVVFCAPTDDPMCNSPTVP